MSTCPIPCPKSSPTPSHMPKPNASKISSFQNKIFLFSKTYYRVSVKFIEQPSKANLLDNPPKQFMGPFRCELLDNFKTQFSGKSFVKIPFTIFSFLFSFMSCTHSYYSRVPQCIWNALCQSQQLMLIYKTCIY